MKGMDYQFLNEEDFEQSPKVVLKILLQQLSTLNEEIRKINERLDNISKIELKIQEALDGYAYTRQCCEETERLKDSIKELENKIISLQKDVEQAQKISKDIAPLTKSVVAMQTDLREIQIKLQQVETTMKSRISTFWQIITPFLAAAGALLANALIGGLLHYIEKGG